MGVLVVPFGEFETRRIIGVARSLHEAEEVALSYSFGEGRFRGLEDYYGIARYESGFSQSYESDVEVLELPELYHARD